MILQTPWWATEALAFGMLLSMFPLVFSFMFWEKRRWVVGSLLTLLGVGIFAVGVAPVTFDREAAIREQIENYYGVELDNYAPSRVKIVTYENTYLLRIDNKEAQYATD